jgi:hypothetical protein
MQLLPLGLPQAKSLDPVASWPWTLRSGWETGRQLHLQLPIPIRRTYTLPEVALSTHLPHTHAPTLMLHLKDEVQSFRGLYRMALSQMVYAWLVLKISLHGSGNTLSPITWHSTSSPT